MKTKLNGWQRLWIVSSIIYLLGVILVLSDCWPSKEEIESSWVYAVIEVIKDPNDHAYTIRETYRDIPDQELIQRIQNNYGEDEKYRKELTKTNQLYQKQIDSLGKTRLKAVGIALMAWIMPIGLLYVLGLTIGWIYRGFKKPEQRRG